MFNLLVLDNVLLCIPLRIGNIFLGLMGALFYAATCIRLIIQYTISAGRFAEQFYVVSMISVLLVHSIVCLIFVVGVLKRKQHMLLPWLISQIIMTCLVTVHFLLNHALEMRVLLAICWTGFQVYIWICGLSVYQPSHLRKIDFKLLSDERVFYPKINGLNRILFCIPLRVGNIIFGLSGLVVYLAIAIWLIIKLNGRVHHSSVKFNVGLLIAASLVQSSICLIYVLGLLKRNNKMLLPWLYSQLLMIVLPVVLYFVTYHSHAVVPYALYWIAINGYIWFCGYSSFEQIEESKCYIKSNQTNCTTTSNESKTLRNIYKLRGSDIPELPVFENVLFVIPLQAGNVAMGIVGAIVYMVLGIRLLVKYLTKHHHYPDRLYYLLMIGVMLPHAIMCAQFVIGILMKKRNLMMSWLFSHIVMTVAIFNIYFAVYNLSDVMPYGIFWIVLQTYIWFCGFSVYNSMPTRVDEYFMIPSSDNDTNSEVFVWSDYKHYDLRSKIPVLRNVLFFIPLRFGNILLGLIESGFYLVVGIYLLTKSITDARHFRDKVYYISMCSILMVHSLFCISFVYGLLKSKRLMLLPWLVSQTIMMVSIGFLQFIYNRNHVVIGYIIYWIALHTYIWLCGYSVYQCTPSSGTDYDTIPSSESDTMNADISSEYLNPKVPVMENVLFCFPLRIGNIIIGSITASFYLIMCICLVIQSTHDAPKFRYKFYFISMISVTLVHSILCARFVVGVLKKNLQMLVPWLISQAVITITTVTLNFIVYETTSVYITLIIAWILIQAYIWLCGYSIYQLTPEVDNNMTTEIDIEVFEFRSDLTLFEKVVFCIPLRIGNLVLSVMGAILYFVLSILVVKAAKYTSDTRYISQKFYFLSMLSVLMIHSIACLIFVVGILKKKQHMVQIWLFSQFLMIFIPVVLHLVRYPSTYFIQFATYWIVLQTYIWFCGYSFYQRTYRRSEHNNLPPLIESDIGILISSKYQDGYTYRYQ